MHPSLRLLSARAHTPLIRFLGKRSWPSGPESPHPHPAAPAEFRKTFGSDSMSTSSAKSSPRKGGKESAGAFNEFWEAPDRFWRYRVRELEESEIDAISSGGATLY